MVIEVCTITKHESIAIYVFNVLLFGQSQRGHGKRIKIIGRPDTIAMGNDGLSH